MHFTLIIILIVNFLYCHANILPDELFSEKTLTCREAGMCNAEYFTIQVVTDMNECILLCHKSNLCKWSTYNSANNYCWLFQDCPEIDTSICQNCVTNQKECDILCKYIMF